ncbi:MAG: rRNA pseudouridine synthase [Candidatus Atribacteria bacterium]|nr:rRNA pseudouridine synthase [Candidatus Atribacteria bacterium]
MRERLQKYLARAGIDSRRKCEELILWGKVRVNNLMVTKLGTKINPQEDIIEVKGKLIKYKEKKDYTYILLNKPQGYLTSLYDPYHRPTIFDLLKGITERIYPVGRLDFNSEGLLILTNDGELTYGLTHPSKKIEKTYIVKVKGIPSLKKLNILSKGIILENNYKILPCNIHTLKIISGNAILKIKLREGKKRQIRKMGEYIGHPVLKLRRIQIDSIRLKGVKPGEYRHLNKQEINSLKKIIYNKSD